MAAGGCRAATFVLQYAVCSCTDRRGVLLRGLCLFAWSTGLVLSLGCAGGGRVVRSVGGYRSVGACWEIPWEMHAQTWPAFVCRAVTAWGCELVSLTAPHAHVALAFATTTDHRRRGLGVGVSICRRVICVMVAPGSQQASKLHNDQVARCKRVGNHPDGNTRAVAVE